MSRKINRVLVVDDDASIRDAVSDLLEDLDYGVLRAADGEEARQVLLEDADVSLILTDFRMPRLNGAELIAWCREAGYRMPVVLMSAERVLLAPEKNAFCDCCALLLYKPFDVDTLVRFLKAAENLDHTACLPRIA